MGDSNTSRALAREKWLEIQDSFFATLRAYVRLGEMSVIAAVVNDDDQPPNAKLGPGSIAVDFKCDCERITERVLHGDEAAQRVWFRFASGEFVPPVDSRDVILRCGSAYRDAELPSYFAPILRKGRSIHATV